MAWIAGISPAVAGLRLGVIAISEQGVVDESRLVHPHGDGEERVARLYLDLFFHGRGVDDGHVDDAKSAIIGQEVSGFSHEPFGPAFALCHHCLYIFECAV